MCAWRFRGRRISHLLPPRNRAQVKYNYYARPLRFGSSDTLRSLAAVSRPDICARLSALASRVSHLQVYDVFRVNELARIVKRWRERESDLVLNNKFFGAAEVSSAALRVRIFLSRSVTPEFLALRSVA